jgi:hypothetical protein
VVGAVVVRDVQGGQVVVAAGVELDPRVLVVVRDVAQHAVAGGDDVDAVGVTPPALRVEARVVAGHGDAAGAAGQQDAGAVVVVGVVVAHHGGDGAADADARRGLATGRSPRAGYGVAGHGDVVATRDIDAIGHSPGEGQTGQGDVAATRDVRAIRRAGDDGGQARPGGDRDRRSSGSGHGRLDDLGVRAVPDVEGIAGREPAGTFRDGAVRRCRGARPGIRAGGAGLVDVQRHRRGRGD